ncbi:C4-dicarboxylate ABC transporter permease [Vibrio sp. 10N.286.49.C2]|uniref:TRAP transporter small permease n=1 Tax=unclassified Vibrio TaxID=2614977 RepID=UPI000C817314|nr:MULTISPECIES: TRAP transporter small permease [unclassified Vibrio]PMH38177.1 C4-dicarboxylate ABC transporter permease [Vibrio sp. 10N.286.49.C2]PMH53617.1 C4-dicarboxylate ABC transporter permease [Vibrio sp. 10N.286.49.B1]
MLKAIESALNKVNAPLAKVTAHISGILLLIMTIIVLLQVFCRYVLNIPLSWTDESSRFLMIYMTYLCLPIIYLEDKNIAMTFVTDKLKGRRIYEVFMMLTHLIALVLFSIWIYFGYAFFKTGSVMADSLPIPMFVIYAIPPVMLTVSCSFAIQKLVASIHQFIHFKPEQEKLVSAEVAE